MEDYKNHIEQTRQGNVGSSDAKMLQQIAELGKVPQSAVKRMAIIKGLVENDNITTPAMRFGDRIENEIFAMLKETDSRWESNPCIFSGKYERNNVGCLSHVDYYLKDDKHKTITIGEAKATKLSFAQAKDEYLYQLCHHYLLAKEIAKTMGDYKVKILLCVYDTNGVDYDDHVFDPQRLTVKPLRNMERLSKSYELGKAMDIVDAYLETLEFYSPDDEIEASYLPQKVKTEFDTITTFLAEIKEREQKVEDFKRKLYDFMSEKNIKSIKNDSWTITRVDPSESIQFDSKAFLADYASKYPRKAKKLLKTFEKRVKRKGSVQIRLKDNNNK